MEYIPKDIFDLVGKIVYEATEAAQKKKNPEMKEGVYFIEIVAISFKNILAQLPPFIA